MEVRKYQPGDRTQCIDIFKSNAPLFFDPTELADFEFWLNGQDENRLAYKQTKAEYYYVVEQDNTVVACGGFYIPREEERGNMVWGMVSNSLHRQGIGRKLFQFRMDQILRNILTGSLKRPVLN